ncbi:MAG: M20/M25/M40 family metallo-hydrolase, partial [Candidatus Bathyarchaeia archaeon]
MFREISESVDRRREEAVAFLQELIRTPSPSGREAEAAEVVAGRMRAAGFDAVRVDGLNDVTATIKGSGGGRSLLMNGHIDHVPVGDMVDPYSGKLMDGAPFGVEGEVVYGRAASDMKGAVAAMVMAGAVLRDLDVELEGDLRVAAVAQEEVGGAGTIATIQEGHFLGDVVVIGEGTNMEIALGHRGGAGTIVVVRGRSCHASAPERGVNALYKAVDLIARIRSELVPRLP